MQFSVIITINLILRFHRMVMVLLNDTRTCIHQRKNVKKMKQNNIHESNNTKIYGGNLAWEKPRTIAPEIHYQDERNYGAKVCKRYTHGIDLYTCPRLMILCRAIITPHLPPRIVQLRHVSGSRRDSYHSRRSWTSLDLVYVCLFW